MSGYKTLLSPGTLYYRVLAAKQGYVFNGSGVIDDPGSHNWQLRISLAHSQENLALAAKTIQEVLLSNSRYSHFGFKVMSLRSNTYNAGAGSSSVGEHALAADLKMDEDPLFMDKINEDFLSDRRQAGKELNIYLFENKELALSPKQYKELLLQIWVALQDAGVNFHQSACPENELVVKLDCGSGVFVDSPFCRSADKFDHTFEPRKAPYNGELGLSILAQETDPLDGIVFTFDDLAKYKISLAKLGQQLDGRRDNTESTMLQFLAHLEAFQENIPRKVNPMDDKAGLSGIGYYVLPESVIEAVSSTPEALLVNINRMVNHVESDAGMDMDARIELNCAIGDKIQTIKVKFYALAGPALSKLPLAPTSSLKTQLSSERAADHLITREMIQAYCQNILENESKSDRESKLVSFKQSLIDQSQELVKASFSRWFSTAIPHDETPHVKLMKDYEMLSPMPEVEAILWPDQPKGVLKNNTKLSLLISEDTALMQILFRKLYHYQYLHQQLPELCVQASNFNIGARAYVRSLTEGYSGSADKKRHLLTLTDGPMSLHPFKDVVTKAQALEGIMAKPRFLTTKQTKSLALLQNIKALMSLPDSEAKAPESD